MALENGTLRRFEIVPADAGLSRSDPEALKGGDPATNAAALRAVLDGARNPYRDIAVLNAAAALLLAQKAGDLRKRRRWRNVASIRARRERFSTSS